MICWRRLQEPKLLPKISPILAPSVQFMSLSGQVTAIGANFRPCLRWNGRRRSGGRRGERTGGRGRGPVGNGQGNGCARRKEGRKGVGVGLGRGPEMRVDCSLRSFLRCAREEKRRGRRERGREGGGRVVGALPPSSANPSPSLTFISISMVAERRRPPQAATNDQGPDGGRVKTGLGWKILIHLKNLLWRKD